MQTILPPDEKFLHHLWMQIPHLTDSLTLTDGTPVEVLNPGEHNQHAGPDFLQAMIRINGVTWCGSVEIHINASDWNRHGHQNDPAYNGVILHVVANPDADAYSNDGQRLPTVQLPDVYRLWQRLTDIFQNKTTPRCGRSFAAIPAIKRDMWLTRMAAQRFEEKAKSIIAEAERLPLGWDEALFQSLMRSMGLSRNADPMLQTAKSIPFRTILRNRDSLTKTEAILQGQAGFLLPAAKNYPNDLHIQMLWAEYQHQKNKYELTGIDPLTWNLKGIRPSGYPFIRLSQISVIYHQQPNLLNTIIEAKSLKDLLTILGVQAAPYWDTHYQFGKISKRTSPKRVGELQTSTVLINTVVPFKYAWAMHTGDDFVKIEAYKILEALAPEDNTITRAFADIGITVENAYDSQAIIELAKNYCGKRLCYLCPAGMAIYQATLAPIPQSIPNSENEAIEKKAEQNGLIDTQKDESAENINSLKEPAPAAPPASEERTAKKTLKKTPQRKKNAHKRSNPENLKGEQSAAESAPSEPVSPDKQLVQNENPDDAPGKAVSDPEPQAQAPSNVHKIAARALNAQQHESPRNSKAPEAEQENKNLESAEEWLARKVIFSKPMSWEELEAEELRIHREMQKRKTENQDPKKS